MLISLSAVMLVPSPSFRSMAGGIMLSVVFVLAATLTLLPLVLFKLDQRINKFVAALGAHRRAPLAEVRAPGASGSGGAPSPFGLASLVVLLALAAPVLGLKTAMPSIKVLPEDASARVGYDLVKDAFGDGAPGTLQVVADRADADRDGRGARRRTPGIAGAMPRDARHGRHATYVADPGRADRRPLRPRAGDHRRPAPRRPARLRAWSAAPRSRTST